MNNIERLTLIESHLRKLLAIAEKRTLGKWQMQEVAGGLYVSVGNPKTGEGYRLISGVTKQSRYQSEENGSFIAACAGNAEAGWKSTLLQIEWLKDDLQSAEEDGDFDSVRALERRIDSILAAYPIELFQ